MLNRQYYAELIKRKINIIFQNQFKNSKNVSMLQILIYNEIINFRTQGLKMVSKNKKYNVYVCYSSNDMANILNLSNKFMSLLPLINRPFNSHSFSNPLHGFIYGELSSNDKTKSKQFYTISNRSPSYTKSKYSTINQSKMQTSREQKQQKAVQSVQKRNYHQTNKSVLKKYHLDMTFSEQSNQELALSSRISRRQTNFVYPSVQVIPLHLITNYEDKVKYNLSISLQSFFKLFFPPQFKHNQKRLIHHLQTYIPKLKHYNVLDKQLVRTQWPQKFWKIKNNADFLQISQSYDNNSQYWTKYILVLICIYFVPHKLVRSKCLQNLKLTILKKLHQQKQLFQFPHQKFVCLNEKGVIVEDFLDISFSTTKVYIAKREQPQKILQKLICYENLLKSHKAQDINKGFQKRLRNHFRKQTVQNKYTQQTINYDRDISSKEKQRKRIIQKASSLIQQKKQKALKFDRLIDTSNLKLRSFSQMQSQSFRQTQEIKLKSISVIEKQQESFDLSVHVKDQKVRRQIITKFQSYHEQGKQKNAKMKQDEIMISSLIQNQSILQQMVKNSFHNRKIKNIFEIIKNKDLQENWIQQQTLSWREFVDFSIITSKDIQKLILNPDCYERIRIFVQKYMEMSQDDYFRDQLTVKLSGLVETNNQNINLAEQVLWNWLSQNNFIRLGSIQRQLLRQYAQTSKKFYFLMISLIFCTYKTTLMDMAHQLLV